MALRGIMQERGGEQVSVIVTSRQEPLGNVERVSPIRDRHRGEQGVSPRRQDSLDERLLDRIDPGTNVRDELPNPMHRSVPPSAAAPAPAAPTKAHPEAG